MAIVDQSYPLHPAGRQCQRQDSPRRNRSGGGPGNFVRGFWRTSKRSGGERRRACRILITPGRDGGQGDAGATKASRVFGYTRFALFLAILLVPLPPPPSAILLARQIGRAFFAFSAFPPPFSPSSALVAASRISRIPSGSQPPLWNTFANLPLARRQFLEVRCGTCAIL